MREHRFWVASFLSACILISGHEGLAARQNRVIKAGPGAGPISDKILQGEKALIIEDGSYPPYMPTFPAGTSPIPKTVGRGSVLIVRQLSINGRLTAAKDWIVSDWRLQIDEIVRLGDQHPFKKNSVFSVTQDGGTLKIGDTQVIAKQSWAKDLYNANRYLVIVYWYPEVGPQLHPAHVYRIGDDGALEGRVPGRGLDGLILKNVVEEVRALR